MTVPAPTAPGPARRRAAALAVSVALLAGAAAGQDAPPAAPSGGVAGAADGRPASAPRPASQSGADSNETPPAAPEAPGSGNPLGLRLSQSAGLSLTYTDNADLEPDATAESEVIARADYAISLSGAGARARYGADLSLGFSYGTETQTELEALGSARLSLELARRQLTLDFGANLTRPLLDGQSRASLSDAGRRTGRTQAASAFAQPRYRIAFGRQAELVASHRLSYATAEDRFGDEIGNLTQLQLASGPAFSRLSLDVTGLRDQRSRSRDDGGAGADLSRDDDLVQQSIDGGIGYAINRRLRVFARAGYEDVDADRSAFAGGNVIWRVGVAAQGVRGRLTVSYGRAFGEQTWAAEGTYELTPRLTLVGSYTDQLDTPGSRLAGGAGFDPDTGLFEPGDPAAPPRLVDDTVDLGEGVTRTQLAQLALIGRLGLNDVRLEVTHEDRSEGDDGPGAGGESSTTGRASLGRPLARNVSGSLEAYLRQDRSRELDGETYGAAASIDWRISRRVSANVRFDRTDRTADDPSDEYTENAVTAGLRLSF